MMNRKPIRFTIPLMALLALYCALVAVFWVGFIASDDVTFANGGYGWIEDFPFVGGHGTIRYPITIPLALSFLSFGGNEIALALPSLLYMMGAMAIGYYLVCKMVGQWAAILAMLCAITVPLFMVQGSIANVDMPELFFQLGSIAFFMKGLQEERPAKLFFAAGAMAGLGFLTRETSVFIALFYAVLFFAGYKQSRWHYLWIAVGFMAVWAVELFYLGIMTGDPFYRITISLHHDSSIDRSIDLAGNVLLHPAIDPLLVLLINQEFMALFWLAIPAAAWLMTSRKVPAGERQLARLLSLYSAAIFIATGAAVTLLPLNPRYFTAPTFVAALLLGMALAQLWRSRPIVAALVLAGVVTTNMLGAYVENRHSMFGVRTYADLAARLEEPIYTDAKTHYRATLLLKWNGAAERAASDLPRAGALYLFNPALADGGNGTMPQGTVIATMQPRPDVILRGIEALGITPLFPAGIWKRVSVRHEPVALILTTKHTVPHDTK